MKCSGPQGRMAFTVKIGEKGQFVVPKEARELFDIQPGDTLLLLCDPKKGIAIPPKSTIQQLTARIFAQGEEDDT